MSDRKEDIGESGRKRLIGECCVCSRHPYLGIRLEFTFLDDVFDKEEKTVKSPPLFFCFNCSDSMWWSLMDNLLDPLFKYFNRTDEEQE